MKQSFSEARTRFVEALEGLRADLAANQTDDCMAEIIHLALEYIPESPADEMLYTDVAIVRSGPNKKPGMPHNQGSRNPKRDLCFVSSGIHGIEGYAGSALQTLTLGQSDLIRSCLVTTDLCFIHAANPWGMHNFERTDERNRDLNRNCHTVQERYAQKNPTLSILRTLTAPKKPVRLPAIGPLAWRDWTTFYARLVGLFIRNGVKASTLAVVNGQYEHPDEIFYGGNSLSPHLRRLQLLLVDNLCTTPLKGAGREYGSSYETCSVIDIHTGLGPKGGLTLLLAAQSPLHASAWQAQLGGYKIQFENRTEPVIPGIFADWLCELVLPQKPQHHAAIVFEIGTFGKGSILSNLESLKRMVEANQLRHFGTDAGDGAETTAESIRDRFRELFLPSDAAWEQTLVTARFQDLQKLLTILAHHK